MQTGREEPTNAVTVNGGTSPGPAQSSVGAWRGAPCTFRLRDAAAIPPWFRPPPTNSAAWLHPGASASWARFINLFVQKKKHPEVHAARRWILNALTIDAPAERVMTCSETARHRAWEPERCRYERSQAFCTVVHLCWKPGTKISRFTESRSRRPNLSWSRGARDLLGLNFTPPTGGGHSWNGKGKQRRKQAPPAVAV